MKKKNFLRFVREPPLKSEVRVYIKVKLLLKLFQDRYKPPATNIYKAYDTKI